MGWLGSRAREQLPFLGDDATTAEWLLHEHVYPLIREWGVVIGGSNTRAARPDECPATLEALFSIPRDDADQRTRPWEAPELQRAVQEVRQGFGILVGAAQHAASWLLHQPLDADDIQD